VELPTQSRPPWSGARLEQDRVLVRRHWSLHAPQSNQGLHTPSTAAELNMENYFQISCLNNIGRENEK
jgi:hypothetical protein